jgi:hypothetical protein
MPAGVRKVLLALRAYSAKLIREKLGTRANVLSYRLGPSPRA